MEIVVNFEAIKHGKMHPLVSVICICHNHQRFVKEAILSVLEQTYQNIQLIIIDVASTDGSVEEIKRILKGRGDVQCLFLKENIGHCAAFNRALLLSNGDFVIDLAADDILLPDRVALGVHDLLTSGEEYGVSFSNAARVDEEGEFIAYHYKVGDNGTALQHVPQGDVFEEVIKRYFICSPTMLFRKKVIDELSGYDDTLLYEDFDFWVRSSRIYKYVYRDMVLVKKRVVKNSASQRQFRIRSKYQYSTYQVCRKIVALVRTSAEKEALKKRLKYEVTMAIRLLQPSLAVKYLRLLKSLN